MIRFELNGRPVAVEASADRNLAALLREELDLRGTKLGCQIGRCGACIVLLDGEAVNSCLLMGWQVEGRRVTTIEGLGAHPAGRALMQGLTEENAFQCGYCAPGVVMSLAGLLAGEPDPDEEQVKAALEGNICRCTGYHSILRGALAAVRHQKDRSPCL
ncbi:(2Fe-2S)-binding protein [Rubellimicrobium arenae]|uniref:(2Fe-2S)-binding protein n=1 Tax=Rubellimicrobium arenae TaxID=2817372 RepID=UPI001B3166A0|nr:(2Fe-2S)-binding protein [Rubellimicrobium arenae]